MVSTLIITDHDPSKSLNRSKVRLLCTMWFLRASTSRISTESTLGLGIVFQHTFKRTTNLTERSLSCD